MMTSIPPVPEIYRLRNSLFAQLPPERYAIIRLPYKNKELQKEEEKEDSELVKKVYASVGIGKNLDLTA